MASLGICFLLTRVEGSHQLFNLSCKIKIIIIKNKKLTIKNWNPVLRKQRTDIGIDGKRQNTDTYQCILMFLPREKDNREENKRKNIVSGHCWSYTFNII